MAETGGGETGISRALKYVIAGAAGAMVGAAIGLLFAPKAGKQTREDLKAKGAELKEKAAAAGGKLGERAAAVAQRAREVGEQIKAQAEKAKGLRVTVVQEPEDEEEPAAEEA